jgi:hypothetical protein
MKRLNIILLLLLTIISVHAETKGKIEVPIRSTGIILMPK